LTLDEKIPKKDPRWCFFFVSFSEEIKKLRKNKNPKNNVFCAFFLFELRSQT